VDCTELWEIEWASAFASDEEDQQRKQPIHATVVGSN
jgi:hypothetical protein